MYETWASALICATNRVKKSSFPDISNLIIIMSQVISPRDLIFGHDIRWNDNIGFYKMLFQHNAERERERKILGKNVKEKCRFDRMRLAAQRKHILRKGKLPSCIFVRTVFGVWSEWDFLRVALSLVCLPPCRVCCERTYHIIHRSLPVNFIWQRWKPRTIFELKTNNDKVFFYKIL